MKKDHPTYRILGVDPGTNILGFAMIEIVQKKMKLLELGVVHLSKFPNQPQKLKKIFERIQTIIEVYRPRELAIEAPFYGKNPQSMLKLGRAQGVAIAAAVTMEVTVSEYLPKKIKQSVTGNGNAAKEQVAAMLGNQFQIDLTDHYLDATDALATAVCHFYQSSSALGGKKQYTNWSSFLKDNPKRKG
ncbi:MAG: crossover junction endodeoxyribonuclease RuvC [Saprospiraceae bacterium]|nr:MAG: crossover junction endodeoxyribonuclease RuvC [Saprospiraceae bacterium]